MELKNEESFLNLFIIIRCLVGLGYWVWLSSQGIRRIAALQGKMERAFVKQFWIVSRMWVANGIACLYASVWGVFDG